MILGLTGAIGSGKSAVLHFWKKNGICAYDADKICHGLYLDAQTPFGQMLCARWGKGVLNQCSGFNRKKIADIVFNDRDELDFLTTAIQPALTTALNDVISRSRNGEITTIIELPLLFEQNWQHILDKTVTVWCRRDLRLQRLAGRGMTAAEAEARQKLQWSADDKLEAADFALINNGDRNFLEKQCLILMQYVKGK